MGKVLYPSYFTTCIETGTPSAENAKDYLDLNLRQAMTLFWRVKKWEGRISGGYVEQFNQGTYTTTLSGGENYAELNQSISSPNEEADLVCSTGQFLFSRDAGNFSTTGPAYSAQGNLILSFRYFFNNALSNGNRIYPAFSIGGGGSSEVDGGQVGSYTLSFYDCDKSGPLYTLLATSGSVSIDIRATEYWSYGGTYNTSTGARL